MTVAVTRTPRARCTCLAGLLALFVGCAGPAPAPAQDEAVSPPRQTPELGRPRPKLLPPEAAAGSARAEGGR